MRKFRALDSGAYTFFNQRRKQHKGGKPDWSLYSTKEFYSYLDAYAVFVKKYGNLFDFCVTIDAIGNPSLSWKLLKHIEKEHGIFPLPVLHFGADLKWIHKYIDSGYKYIGIGKVGKRPDFTWSDKVWDVICSTPDRKPQIKVHGFALTNISTMIRYPWYSVDSVTWKKMGFFGQVLIPPKIDGRFVHWSRYKSVFMDTTIKMKTRHDALRKDEEYEDGISPYRKGTFGKGRHFEHMKPNEQSDTEEWLDLINAPLGFQDSSGKIMIKGVTNNKQERVAANIKLFGWLEKQMPKWPWSWQKPFIRSKLTELMK